MDLSPSPAEAAREDRLLGGRVRLMQPGRGYRAATDPVLLAAAVPARAGERVLDLGCGAGAAVFCLAARVPGLALHGLELQPDCLALARDSARLNGVELTLHAGDVADPPAALRQLAFDHVMLNPPYHAEAAAASPLAARDRAHRESGATLADWIATALARLRPRGWLTVIHRAERVPELLRLLDGPAGAIALKPLVPRAGRAAGRVIAQARKGARGPFRLLAPLVLHAGAAHLRDTDDFSPEAAAILRGAAALDLQETAP
ncbi:MAG TPA: methyltransferase [Thermohalobaculum sp.]|nr:methyltransferase [Thermohalobaculum sp.]